MVRFYAAKSVEISISPAPLPIGEYLSNSERLVYALIDPKRVSVVGKDRFQFKIKPVRFMMLNLEPESVVEITSNEAGEVLVYSDTCKLRHQEFFNRHFIFKLEGVLAARPDNSGVSGNAELEIKIDLPSAFRLTPKPLLESTGSAILSGILATIKQRLQKQLIRDYRAWTEEQLKLAEANSSFS